MNLLTCPDQDRFYLDFPYPTGTKLEEHSGHKCIINGRQSKNPSLYNSKHNKESIQLVYPELQLEEWDGRGRHLQKCDDTNSTLWKSRAEFLKKLSLLGPGWDGLEAPVPDQRSVEKTLLVMETLQASIDQPPQFLVNDDGGISLTWGKAREGYLIFLTIDEASASLLVMNEDDSVFTCHDVAYADSNRIPAPLIDKIKEYLKYIN